MRVVVWIMLGLLGACAPERKGPSVVDVVDTDAIDTGVDGDSGDSGPSGDSGDSGPSGDSGDSGPSGDSGDSGPSGDSGDSGPSGDSGDSGPAGAPQIDVDRTFDFGGVVEACTETKDLIVRNTGGAPLTVQSFAQTGSATFSVDLVPPFTVPASGAKAVPIHFVPDAASMAYAADLQITSDDPVRPTVVVGLAGRGSAEARAQEDFVLPALPDLDLLFVLDQSCSMGGPLTELNGEIGGVFRALDGLGVDFRVGLIPSDTTSGCNGLTEGWIDNQDADPAAEFASIAATLSTCEGEEAFAATKGALDSTEGVSFLRAGADLSVIAISDEEEQSTAVTPSAFATYLSALKAGAADRVRFSAMVGPRTGGTIPGLGCSPFSRYNAGTSPRFHQAITLSGGVWGDFCQYDLAAFLPRATRAAAGLVDTFPLASVPTDEASIVVDVEGAVVPKSATDGWTLDAGKNAIVLAGSALPGPGETVSVDYPVPSNCP